MAKTSAAACVLFMVLIAFAVQHSEATVLKSILLYKLYKKLTAKKAVPVAPKVAVAVPPPVVRPPPEQKPVFARVTAGTKPAGYYEPSGPSWPAQPETKTTESAGVAWEPPKGEAAGGVQSENFGDGRRL